MRLNKGKPSGQYLGQALENWNIYETDGKHKVSAIEPVTGKANYSFALTEENTIDTHAGLDAGKLRQERPELFEAIENFFRKAPKADKTSDEADPFGDLAISRKRRLSPEQQWKRGLLQFRRIELENSTKGIVSTWDFAVRMLHSGCFKEKISTAKLNDTLRYIFNRRGAIDVQALLQVEQDYYAGKYTPSPCATLEVQLDLLAGLGEQEYKPTEVDLTEFFT